MTPGTYAGEAKGRRGTLKVLVSVSENKIESVEFVEAIPRTNEVIDFAKQDPSYPKDPIDPNAYYPQAMLNETAQFLDTVTSRLGDRIVDAQSLNVDAVCGATVTSFGYINAVRNALEQSGGDISAFDREIKQSTETETYDVDVVVIGGGTSGVTAAATATANGAKVLLMDKSARIGGSGSLSSGGHFYNSKGQLDAGHEFDGIDSFYTDGMSQSLWCAKALLLRQYTDFGGKAVDLIQDKGGFEFRYFPNSLGYAANSLLFPNASESWYRVAKTVDTVLLETKATGLITNDAGAVVGVTAEQWDGKQITVNARSVVVSTGGFLGNPDLMAKYNGFHHSTAHGLAHNVGEGLEMMLNAGAHEFHIGGGNTHLTQTTGEIEGFDDFSAMIPYTLFATPSFMRVNQRGERYWDENAMATAGMTPVGNNMYVQSRYLYTIISQDQMDILAENGLLGVGMQHPPFNPNYNFYPLPADYRMETINEVMEAGVAGKSIFKGDTPEALAEAAGLLPDTFKSHFNRYEKICQAGTDDLFYKDPAYLVPMGSGPYYAIQFEACPFCSLGGVEVDEQMHVLRSDGTPIEGLYASGVETIGNIYGGAAYDDLGGLPFSWAVFSGFATGASAAGKPLVS
jgi:fumarate reductase flavoprotein subunit